MKPRFVVPSILGVLGILAFTVPGAAQQTTPDVLPSGDSQGQTGGNGPATDEGTEKKAEAPAKSTNNVGGYGYSDKPAAGAAPRVRYKSSGPTVAMPGFEQTSDGASRFFVQLSQSVAVEERRAQGSVTYVLKGASPRVYNNTNALVTVHFSTPVSRARLVPAGKDLLFVLDLRAAASPTYKVTETADKGAQLTIEFPKGDWFNAPAIEPEKRAVRTGRKKK
ncbi:MAG: hypothetical protein KIT84_24920 [Labilithrix sp.]|nr:hypothetical protein [Labilithrix sp.]MCW5814293.1 hypothetical protein [Labilithrix sp.]